MGDKYINMRIGAIQVLLVLILFCGGAEAKGIEAGLWGIGWDAESVQIKQSLEGQGFAMVDQGKDSAGRQWEKYGKGSFSDFQCDVKVVWQAKHLSEINIESSGVFLLGPQFTYQSLSARFTDEYGQPREQDRYMLKNFPGVWVEWVNWVVAEKGTPVFAVTIMQSSPADGAGSSEAAPAKISVSFKKIGNESR